MNAQVIALLNALVRAEQELAQVRQTLQARIAELEAQINQASPTETE